MSNEFRQLKPIPASATTAAGLTWGTSSPGRPPLGPLIGLTPGTGLGLPLGHVIHVDGNYLGGDQVLEVLQSERPVLADGITTPLVAFVLSGHGMRVLERVADCLVTALNVAGNPADQIDVRRGAASGADAAVVIVLEWRQRAPARSVIRAALAHDPMIERVLILGAKRDLRRRHDTATAAAFAAADVNPARHMLGLKRHWRFSDFTIVEQAGLRGARFTVRFLFGELERFERALDLAHKLIERSKAARSGIHLRSGTHRAATSLRDAEDTDLLFREPVLQFVVRWSTRKRRQLIATLVGALASVDSASIARPRRASGDAASRLNSLRNQPTFEEARRAHPAHPLALIDQE